MKRPGKPASGGSPAAGTKDYLKAEEGKMEWGKGDDALNEGMLELFADDPATKRKARKDMLAKKLRSEQSIGQRAKSRTSVRLSKGGAVRDYRK